MTTRKIIAINGSPRKNFNTAALLQSFLDGAKSVGDEIEVKMIHLYDYKYTGCRECYLCKMRDGKSYGQCSFRDELTDILREVAEADGIAFGAPVFLGDFGAQFKAFLERLLFPFTSYSKSGELSIAPKKIPTAVFSAMNMTDDYRAAQYAGQMNNTINWIGYIFGSQPVTCFATNTYQFKDYSRYAADLWDEADKKNWHETQFPKDLERAYEIGRQIAAAGLE